MSEDQFFGRCAMRPPEMRCVMLSATWGVARFTGNVTLTSCWNGLSGAPAGTYALSMKPGGLISLISLLKVAKSANTLRAEVKSRLTVTISDLTVGAAMSGVLCPPGSVAPAPGVKLYRPAFAKRPADGFDPGAVPGE